MTKPTRALLETAQKLAQANTRLWTDPIKYGFKEIPAQDTVMSGHDFLTQVIDPWFENNPLTLTERPKDLLFLNDPRVTAFLEAHPQQSENLLEYCGTHVEVKMLTASLDTVSRNSKLSAAIISTVDNKRGESCNPVEIVDNALREKDNRPQSKAMDVASAIADRLRIAHLISGASHTAHIIFDTATHPGRIFPHHGSKKGGHEVDSTR